MGYKNPKALMDAATALPVAIETKLPEGAPKISEKLFAFNEDFLSKAPDFPMELPDLPAVPAFPELPGAPELSRRYVTAVEVRPVTAGPAPMPQQTVTPLVQAYTQPIEGVVGQVQTRRGM